MKEEESSMVCPPLEAELASNAPYPWSFWKTNMFFKYQKHRHLGDLFWNSKSEPRRPVSCRGSNLSWTHVYALQEALIVFLHPSMFYGPVHSDWITNNNNHAGQEEEFKDCHFGGFGVSVCGLFLVLSLYGRNFAALSYNDGGQKLMYVQTWNGMQCEKCKITCTEQQQQEQQQPHIHDD